MAFFFEHFPSLAPSPVALSGGDEPRPQIMRRSGVSSTKLWEKHIDDIGRFTPHPYTEPVDGALLTSFFSEVKRVVDFRIEGAEIPAAAYSALTTTCLCSLPALCAEGTRSVLYRSDRVARQFGYDQGAPGPAPPLKDFVESIRCFTRTCVEELSASREVMTLPENSRETFFTADNHLF